MEENINAMIHDIDEKIDYLNTLVTAKKPSQFIEINGVNMTTPCNNLLDALSKMQGVLDNAKKESENPFYKSKYADLATCLHTAKKPLSENGLAVSQHCTFDGNSVQCVTVLGHSSGQMMVSTLAVPVTKKDPQGIGMAVTYARRYALSAIIGLAQADDDAESAVVHEEQPQAGRPAEKPYEYATDKQVKLIRNIITKYKISADSITARYKVANLESMSKEQASDCIRILKNQVGEE